MKKLLINLALFQIGWLVCVLGGNAWAVPFTLCALAIHAWLVADGAAEWKLIAAIVAAGSLWDISMAQTGVIDYGAANPFGIPLWLFCLWWLFATTFRHCLFWLNRRIGLAILLGAVFGPFSYWAGASLTEAELASPLLASLLVMALGWAILFPCAIYSAGRLKS